MRKYAQSQNDIKVPEYLYHATYLERWPSIKINGLDPNYIPKNWFDSKNVICLAPNSEIAESYAETSEEVDEELLDNIIILKINTKCLNHANFMRDSNIIFNDERMDEICYEYHGKIPPNCITRIN